MLCTRLRLLLSKHSFSTVEIACYVREAQEDSDISIDGTSNSRPPGNKSLAYFDLARDGFMQVFAW